MDISHKVIRSAYVSILTILLFISTSFAEDAKTAVMDEAAAVAAPDVAAAIEAGAAAEVSPAGLKEGEVIVLNGAPWIKIAGSLEKIDLVAMKGMWEESALKRADGELVVLLGEKVGELQDLKSENITVAGYLMPRMRYAGNLIRVVEVHEIIKEEANQGGSR